MEKVFYKVERSEGLFGECITITTGGELVGKITPNGNGFYARHDCRANGGVFLTADDAVDYLIGIDLKINAEFSAEIRLNKDRRRLEDLFSL